jgi:hypothetical protein
MSEQYGHMSKCDCGNIFIPSPKGKCPPCVRADNEAKFSRRIDARIARKEAKRAERLARKRARDEARRQSQANTNAHVQYVGE